MSTDEKVDELAELLRLSRQAGFDRFTIGVYSAVVHHPEELRYLAHKVDGEPPELASTYPMTFWSGKRGKDEYGETIHGVMPDVVLRRARAFLLENDEIRMDTEDMMPVEDAPGPEVDR